ncbi:MAG: type II secretion system F family protein [Candidatus Eremiobacteraeota bacterium]|nr:type II secretion system F family protein [Candidatus Eremiobacteraeota bacterium]
MSRIMEFIDEFAAPATSSADLVIAFRELAALHKASINIQRSFQILADQGENRMLRRAFNGCARLVQSGQGIARAMSSFPLVFPELYVKMIDIGERSGKLELMLERVAIHAEKERELTMKVQSALIYPLFVGFLFLLFLVVGPAFMFKGIYEFLESLKIPLPFPTRLLIMASSLIRSPVVMILFPILAAGAAVLLKTLWQDDLWRGRLQAFFYRVPGVGTALRTAETAHFARTLAIIFDAGIPLIKGVEIARQGTTTVALQQRLEIMRTSLVEGESVREALEKTEFFSPLMLNLVEVGEQSGKMGQMCTKIALISEQNLEQALDVAISVMQPFFLLVMGLVVGFVVIATMAPMVKVVESIL